MTGTPDPVIPEALARDPATNRVTQQGGSAGGYDANGNATVAYGLGGTMGLTYMDRIADQGRLISWTFRGLVQGNVVFRLLPVLRGDDQAGWRRLAHALAGELPDLFLLVENRALAHGDFTVESGSGARLAGKVQLTPVETRP